MDQKASEITKYIGIKTNAWIKNTIVTKDEIVKSQNSFIETNMAIKNTMPTSTIVVRILGGIAIV